MLLSYWFSRDFTLNLKQVAGAEVAVGRGRGQGAGRRREGQEARVRVQGKALVLDSFAALPSRRAA